jgi:hypothetical protein
MMIAHGNDRNAAEATGPTVPESLTPAADISAVVEGKLEATGRPLIELVVI